MSIDTAILADALKWSTFIETASNNKLPPAALAEQVATLYQKIEAGGGKLAPNDIAEIVKNFP